MTQRVLAVETPRTVTFLLLCSDKSLDLVLFRRREAIVIGSRVTGPMLFLLLTGCAASGAVLSSDERDGIPGFDLGALPVTMTLQQEVAELLVQPILMLSRSHDGTVQIRNSIGVSDPYNKPLSAPLLTLFSCPIQPTVSRLSDR
jgi:hypothetical protein